jgi:hypothetical protein
MDSSVPAWKESKDGCNYCDSARFTRVYDESALWDLASKIRETSKDSPYDVVLGLSGGLDSSFSLHLAKQLDLRVFVVHMDNGWNDVIAQNNIKSLVQSLNFDLNTYVIEWSEMLSLQKSFFDADVIDVELLYDQAVSAILFLKARELNIKFIVLGTNNATEGIPMPIGWSWKNKSDVRNILDIHRKYGDNTKITSYPLFSTFDIMNSETNFGIRRVSLLDRYNYSKLEAEQKLVERYDYKVYKEKHGESFFTRFYQNVILPLKFNVDKRKVHLSSLVINGELNREDALQVLNQKRNFESIDRDDLYFFLDKFEWQIDDFMLYLKRPPVSHSRFKSDEDFLGVPRAIYKNLKKYRFTNVQDTTTILSTPKSSMEDLNRLKKIGYKCVVRAEKTLSKLGF